MSVCGLHNLELKMLVGDDFVEFRKTLVHGQDEAADGLVFVALGKFEGKELVGLLYLQAARKQIFVAAEIFGYIVLCVVLVLNVTEDFFHKILERYDAGSTAELVHHNGQSFFLRDEGGEQFLRRHGFGDDGQMTDMLRPVVGVLETEHL